MNEAAFEGGDFPMAWHVLEPTSGFPKHLFACAIALTAIGIVWLGWIAEESLATAARSAERAAAFTRTAKRVADLAGPPEARGGTDGGLEPALIEAIHLLATAEDEDRIERASSGATPGAPQGAATALLHSLVVAVEPERSAPWIQAALVAAAGRLEQRSVAATRRAWTHLVGSVGVFGSLAFAWLALTRSLESSRAALQIEVRRRTRIAEELAVARDAALESGRLKSAFLRNMSHEIRTPVSILLGNAAELGERAPGTDPDEAGRIVETIRRAGRRLIDTVDGIMDLARMESGGFEVSPRAIALGAFVFAVATRFRARASEKGLGFEIRSDEPGPTITFDERCLERALANLIDNAVKFTERGSVAVVLREDAGGGFAIDVHDTGIGISPEYRGRLFEPFSQQESDTTRKFEGVGIGLALARGYVEANGSRISIETGPTGSRFTIHVPAPLVRHENAGEDSP